MCIELEEGGVTQLSTYKKQLHSRDEQKFIPLQRIYFERNKYNKYISAVITMTLYKFRS